MRKAPTPVIFQGLEAGVKMFRWVIVALLILFFASGIRFVTSENVGLLLQFGKLQGKSYATQVKEPGLVIAMPYPIDQLLQVPVKQEGEVVVTEVWKEIVNLAASDKIDPTLEGYCLTGDQNIVQTKIVVKYRITDPIRYRLWMDNPEGMLHDIVLASLTQTVAGWNVDNVLRLQRPTNGSTESLASLVKQNAQRRLDEIDCGLTIFDIEFKEMHPPRHVVAEFRDVQNARIDIKTAMQTAKGFVAGKIPEAEAESNQMIQAARAHDSAIKAKARAEHSVFAEVYKEYKKNPQLVSQRILMETFEQIIENVGKLRFVSPGTRVIVSDTENKQ